MFFSDQITHMLTQFVKEHGQTILTDEAKAIREEVFSTLPRPIGRLARMATHRLLLKSTERATSLLSTTCSGRSCDFWFTLVRRLPNVIAVGGNVVNYATTAILKWSEWDADTMPGLLFQWDGEGPSKFGIAQAYAGEDIARAVRIVTLSKIMDEIASAQRWISKGARLDSVDNGRLNLDIPDEVRLAVEAYESRRPEHSLFFEDDGLFIPKRDLTNTDYILVMAGKPEQRFEMAVRGSNQTLYAPFMPMPIAGASIAKALRAYEDAIEETLGVPLESIMHTLNALAQRVMTSIPTLDSAGGISFAGSFDDPKFESEFGFFYRLAQTGQLQFPENYLRAHLGKVPLGLGSDGRGTAEELVSAFFNAFMFDPAQTDELDIALLEPPQFLYRLPGGYCCVDVLATADFLTWVLRRAKQWYATQHGDHFTLAVKRLLNQSDKLECPDHQALFKTEDGDIAEVDLLVKKGECLYAIECKAYTKSRQFWLGNPQAVSQRISKIRQAVLQARHAADVVRRSGAFPGVDAVQWVVCTPTQEYLKPIHRHGMLVDGVPRVCTPEELLLYFEQGARPAPV